MTNVDSISLPSFSFPLREEALSSDGTTTYVYENNAAYPELYDFLGEQSSARRTSKKPTRN